MRAAAKPHREVYVGLKLLPILWLAYLTDVINGEKSGRQAKTIRNEAGGNFIRGDRYPLNLAPEMTKETNDFFPGIRTAWVFFPRAKKQIKHLEERLARSRAI